MNKSNNTMMKKVFHVMYDDDEKLLVAARELAVSYTHLTLPTIYSV